MLLRRWVAEKGWGAAMPFASRTIIAFALGAFLTGSALDAQSQPPPGGRPADAPAPPPRPNSPIPRFEGEVLLPNAIQVQQWMDALRAAWRAGRCDELREGIKEMRGWLRLMEFQVDGLKSMLRDAGRFEGREGQWRRDDLSRDIQQLRDRIEDTRRQLDWLERQPCPPPPPPEQQPAPQSTPGQPPEEVQPPPEQAQPQEESKGTRTRPRPRERQPRRDVQQPRDPGR